MVYSIIKNSRLVLRIGAVGAAIAALMMVIMALLPWPFTFDIPGEEVISGSLVLSPAEFERFVDSISLILIFDNIIFLEIYF